jgi:hypothetical protein
MPLPGLSGCALPLHEGADESVAGVAVIGVVVVA